MGEALAHAPGGWNRYAQTATPAYAHHIAANINHPHLRLFQPLPSTSSTCSSNNLLGLTCSVERRRIEHLLDPLVLVVWASTRRFGSLLRQRTRLLPRPPRSSCAQTPSAPTSRRRARWRTRCASGSTPLSTLPALHRDLCWLAATVCIAPHTRRLARQPELWCNPTVWYALSLVADGLCPLHGFNALVYGFSARGIDHRCGCSGSSSGGGGLALRVGRRRRRPDLRATLRAGALHMRQAWRGRTSKTTRPSPRKQPIKAPLVQADR